MECLLFFPSKTKQFVSIETHKSTVLPSFRPILSDFLQIISIQLVSFRSFLWSYFVFFDSFSIVDYIWPGFLRNSGGIFDAFRAMYGLSYHETNRINPRYTVCQRCWLCGDYWTSGQATPIKATNDKTTGNDVFAKPCTTRNNKHSRWIPRDPGPSARAFFWDREWIVPYWSDALPWWIPCPCNILFPPVWWSTVFVSWPISRCTWKWNGFAVPVAVAVVDDKQENNCATSEGRGTETWWLSLWSSSLLFRCSCSVGYSCCTSLNHVRGFGMRCSWLCSFRNKTRCSSLCLYWQFEYVITSVVFGARMP